MAKATKAAKRKSKGLGAIPAAITAAAPKSIVQYKKEMVETKKELRAIVPFDARQYDAGKALFKKEVADKHCPLALTALLNAAVTAGVARATAVSRGQPEGAEELYADFMAQRDEYMAICQPPDGKKKK